MAHRALRCAFAAIILGFLSGSVHASSVPLINQPLVPAAVSPGSAGFTLTVNGTGFVSGAVVNWNGSARATTFVSGTQVTAAILASDVATAQTAVVTVTNPAPGGGVSNPIFFQVTAPTVGLAFQQSVVSSGRAQFQPVVGDINGDGKMDLVVASDLSQNGVDILLGNGDGTFQSPITIMAAPAGERIFAIAIGDFAGNGKQDVAVSFDQTTFPPASGISVIPGNGDGTFQSPILSTLPSGALATGIIVADVNGDGKSDLVGNCQAGVCVALGNGDGTFQESFAYASPQSTQVSSIAVGDFNGDGKIDIAFTATPRYLAVLFGNGDGTFGSPSIIYTADAVVSESVVAADFNGDGKLDLAFYYARDTVFADSGVLSIFQGNGDGTFQSPVTLPGLPETIDNSVLVPGDFNGDGHLDLAVQNIVVLIGNGAGPLSYSVISLPRYAAAAGDFNGDGRLDLVSADHAQNDQLHLLLQAAPPPDFTGSVNPNFQTIVTAATASYTITVSPIDGFTGTIQFAVTGLPAGATASFSPLTVTASGSTTLTVTTSSSTPTGSYSLTISGSSGTLAHSASIALNVGPANTDFTDFAGSVTPDYQTITPGSITQFNLSVSPINGFTGNVALTVNGLPAGATAVFSPASINGGTGSSVLAISTLASTPTGTYVLTITGSSGGHTHSTNVNLNVGPTGTDFTDFTGSISPASQTIAAGGSASFALTIQPLNGFSSDVALTQEGSPVEVGATNTVILGGAGSSLITFTSSPSSSPGTYTITMIATGGGHTHSRNIFLTITP
jgi:hypothetical protein